MSDKYEFSKGGFGNNLQELRIRKGLTQQEVADELSLNRTTYTKYETGVTEPNLENMMRLARMFDVDFNTLVNSSSPDEIGETDQISILLNKTELGLISDFRKLDDSSQKRLIALMSKMTDKSENNSDKKE